LSQVEDACDRAIIINRGRIGLDKKLSELAAEKPVILVEVPGPKDQVAHVLQTTDGVQHVKTAGHSDGPPSFEVTPEKDEDLPQAISGRIAHNGWTLRLLDLRRRKLEDNFIDLVMHEQEEETSKPAAPPAPSNEAVQAAKNGD